MIIQHNIAALNSHRQLGINNSATSKNLEKLSSGYRINRAGDDAAGLAISEKMRGQIRGLAMAEQNVENGISLIQTAEGGLNETHAILQRMRELAVQSANGTYDNDVDRYNLNKEITALKTEIDRIAESTHYNGIKLLDGSLSEYGINRTETTDTVGADLSTATGLAITFGGTAATGTTTETVGAANDKISLDVRLGADGKLTGTGTLTTNGGKSFEVELTSVTSAGVMTFTVLGTSDDDKDATFTMTFDSAGTGVPTHGFSFEGTFTGAWAFTLGNDTETLKAYQAGEDLIFQIGANGTADQQVGLGVRNMSSAWIGEYLRDTDNNYTTLVTGRSIDDISIATQDDANAAIAVIDHAINFVSSTRSDLGALQNRLEHTLNNLGVTKENLTAAESTIRDVDMAKEMMEYTKNTILVQASQAMLAQAQQLPQGVLQLLR